MITLWSRKKEGNVELENNTYIDALRKDNLNSHEVIPLLAMIILYVILFRPRGFPLRIIRNPVISQMKQQENNRVSENYHYSHNDLLTQYREFVFNKFILNLELKNLKHNQNQLDLYQYFLP